MEDQLYIMGTNIDIMVRDVVDLLFTSYACYSVKLNLVTLCYFPFFFFILITGYCFVCGSSR